MIVSTLNRAPFETRAVWDVTSRGTIVAGSGETQDLREYDRSGVVIREFILPLQRRSVPPEERADSLSALQARIASLSIDVDQIAEVSDLVLRGDVPDSLPFYTAVHVAADDRIWVRVWPEDSPDQQTDYVVFSDQAEFLAMVSVPAMLSHRVPPHFRGGLIVGVTEDPITGVHHVVVAQAPL